MTAEFINTDGIRKMGRPVKLDGVHDVANHRLRYTVAKRDIFDEHNGLEIYTDFEIECHFLRKLTLSQNFGLTLFVL